MLLKECATVIRSKNAGPFIVTFDLLFEESEFVKVTESGLVNPATVAAAFGISENEVFEFGVYDFAKAIKFCIRRSISAGSPGDSDVYGAQQHAPLLHIEAY
ncbi:DUF4387 domain-containing protein [Aquibaculum sediminis]|uniref:DUF4387 domain-containing protein n=1 Tax=Aquibaculum sediminis TaxID=3231907 RepID=UPI003451F365